jgi:hypothetical protein
MNNNTYVNFQKTKTDVNYRIFDNHRVSFFLFDYYPNKSDKELFKTKNFE